MSSSDAISRAKLNAAKKAVEYVLDAEVIGVGTGSTVEKFIEVLARYKSDLRDRVFTGSSIDTVLKLSKLGFKVVDPLSLQKLEVYVDGADEVDPSLNMIKGGGAALTLEKLLTFYSRKRIFIVDHTKLVLRLGEKHPVPIDVLPQAVNMVLSYLMERGYNVQIRYPHKGKYGPVVSDIGGVIIDVKVPDGTDPVVLEKELKLIPGVIETGIFINLADYVIVGYPDRSEVKVRKLSR